MAGSCGSGLAPGNVQFTYAQLQGLWIKAGGNPQSAQMAAAIAEAESSGNSTAYDMDCDGSTDRGLWQINSVHGAASTFDIMGNARAAVAISNNGRDWSPWTTYTSGAYQQYLKGTPPDTTVPHNGTQAAANQPQSTTTPTATESDILCGFWAQTIDPGLCLGEKGAQAVGGKAASQIINTIVGNILNPFITIFAGIMGMTGGTILMVGGAYMIVMQTQTGQQVKQEVQTGEQAAVLAAAPEAGAAGAAGAGAGAGGVRGAGLGSLFSRSGQRPTQGQRQVANQSRAASDELRRRQRVQARQMSTQELLRQESLRYGGNGR